ncbi:hypothetical protein FPOAC1_010319 [Fusarium poae]|uniref:hypothetical protein n=1 Tax=Fusarium poae TaxID=36050 RepID=UPI001CE85C8C|nr:hypothetical protein FPOAC1_010319 [Fusarium poae]KAG8665522.1 hypothetical protein FPOAC1_010319 [Fusarium poae]
MLEKRGSLVPGLLSHRPSGWWAHAQYQAVLLLKYAVMCSDISLRRLSTTTLLVVVGRSKIQQRGSRPLENLFVKLITDFNADINLDVNFAVTPYDRPYIHSIKWMADHSTGRNSFEQWHSTISQPISKNAAMELMDDMDLEHDVDRTTGVNNEHVIETGTLHKYNKYIYTWQEERPYVYVYLGMALPQARILLLDLRSPPIPRHSISSEFWFTWRELCSAVSRFITTYTR